MKVAACCALGIRQSQEHFLQIYTVMWGTIRGTFNRKPKEIRQEKLNSILLKSLWNMKYWTAVCLLVSLSLKGHVVIQTQGQKRICRCKTCCLSPVAHGVALNWETRFRILHILLKVYSKSTREQFPERENEMFFVGLGAVELSLKITIQNP